MVPQLMFFISGSGADIFVFLGNTTYIMECDICHDVVISGGKLVHNSNSDAVSVLVVCL